MTKTRGSDEPWYSQGLRFRCTACGNCCKGPEPGWVVVDDADVERLAEHLELSFNALASRYLRRVTMRGEQVISLREKPRNKDCVFWRDGEGCTVYMARPMQCRQWPFWPEVMASRTSWEAEAVTCPGMNEGKTYSRQEIDRILGGKRGTLRGRKPTRLPSV